jgi:hypothetical protein
MPLNKEDLSFKTLINKEFSTPSRLFFQENTVSTLDINDTEVYSDTIPTTTASAIAAGVGRVLTSFILTPDPSFPTSVWYVISGSGFTPGVSTLPSFALSSSFYQRNFISDKYGSGYTVILRDNAGNQIFPTDAINWIFQYKTGILAIADPGLGSYSTPYRVTVVQYTGKTLSNNRTSGYTGSFSGSFIGTASFALTASFVLGGGGGLSDRIQTGSITASVGDGSVGAPYFFLIKSGSGAGSRELVKINNEGVIQLESYAVAPTAITGGIFYSSSGDFFFGS